jgi:hypothetical protein
MPVELTTYPSLQRLHKVAGFLGSDVLQLGGKAIGCVIHDLFESNTNPDEH